MTLRKRIWQALQALTIAIGIVGFLLLGGAYGLLVYFAHDAGKASPGLNSTTVQPQSGKADTP